MYSLEIFVEHGITCILSQGFLEITVLTPRQAKRISLNWSASPFLSLPSVRIPRKVSQVHPQDIFPILQVAVLFPDLFLPLCN